MDLLALRTLVLSYVNDPLGNFFTPAQVNVFLNNAQRETQKQLLQAGQNWYMQCATMTLVVDQQEYVLPSDFLKSHRVEVITSGNIPNETKVMQIPMSVQQQDLLMQNSGPPGSFFLKKNRIVFWPAPDQAYLVRLYYSYGVTDLSADTDVPDVPTEYHEYLAVLAAQDCFIKDDAFPQLLVDKKATYEKRFREDANNRTLDKSRDIVVTQNDWGGGGWFF